MTIYRAEWGSSTIEIQADFAQASCEVRGTNGRQVADFSHSPQDAMRYTIEREARAEGLDVDDAEVSEQIDSAVDSMVESES